MRNHPLAPKSRANNQISSISLPGDDSKRQAFLVIVTVVPKFLRRLTFVQKVHNKVPFSPVKLLGCPNIFCRRSIQARKSWDKFFHQSHKPATKKVKTDLRPSALRSQQLIDALHLGLKLLLTSCTGSPSHPSPHRSAQFGNPDLVSYPDLEPLPSYWVESSEAAPDP